MRCFDDKPRVSVAMAIMAMLAVTALPARGQADLWQAAQLNAANKAERIMHAASARKGMLGQYLVMRDAYMSDRGNAFRLIFSQYFSWYQSFVGDYLGAQSSFSISQPAQADDSPSPLIDPRWQPQPALQAIPELVKNRQIVMLNEAHHLPLTRSLTVPLLAALRREGFDYLAVETLYASDKMLAQRGYPTADSGFYTQEPIAAEMVRTAMKLGFKVIAYEASDDVSGDAREAEQARSIDAQVFQRDPKARLVVEAGYSHIQTSGRYLDGQSMAEHLRKLSGIEPFAVEQTMMIPSPSPPQGEHPIYVAAMAKLAPTRPVVFVGTDGKAWSLRPGYDVSVFFPPQHAEDGRPTWAELDGLRRALPIDSDLCRNTFPCLLQARYAAEGDDAVPADRMLFDPDGAQSTVLSRSERGQMILHGVLYLRPGHYVIEATDAEGRQLGRREADVAGT